MCPLESDVVALLANLADLKPQMLFLHASVGKCHNNSADSSAHMHDVTSSVSAYPELLGKPLIVNLETYDDVALRSSSKSESTAVLPKQLVTPSCSKTATVAAGSSSTQTTEESLEWAVVNRKNKLVKAADALLPSSLFSSSSSLVCATVSNIPKLKATRETHSWHCKISNLHKDVSVNVVQEHLQSLNIEAFTVDELHSRSSSALSMHVVVPYDANETVMCHNFWPKSIRVSGWRLRGESRHQVDRQNSQFQRNWEYYY